MMFVSNRAVAAISLATLAAVAGCADRDTTVAPIQPRAASYSQSSNGNGSGNWALSMTQSYLMPNRLIMTKTEEFSVSMRFKPLSLRAGDQSELATNVGVSDDGQTYMGWDILFIADGPSSGHLGFNDLTTFTTVDAPQTTMSTTEWHVVEVGRHNGRWFATVDGRTRDLGPLPVPAPITSSPVNTFNYFFTSFNGWVDNFAINDLATHSTIESFSLEEGTGTTIHGSRGTTMDLPRMAWVTTASDQGGNGSDNQGHTINSCGAVITEPGNYVVTHDLVDCSGRAIDIRASNVRLRLKGHAIGGVPDQRQIGIAVGVGVAGGVHDVDIVGPGEVREFDAGVVFEGVENSSITGLVVDFNTYGIVPNAGFIAGQPTHYSTNNVISANGIFENLGHAITMNGGTRNLMTANDIERNGDGILLYSGGQNTVSGNLVVNNFGNGIYVERDAGDAIGNLITANRSTGNSGSDLLDRWGDCTHNTWTGNVFGTSNPGCIH